MYLCFSLFHFYSTVCLDSSAPGYHFRRGFGSGSNNWVLHIEVLLFSYYFINRIKLESNSNQVKYNYLLIFLFDSNFVKSSLSSLTIFELSFKLNS